MIPVLAPPRQTAIATAGRTIMKTARSPRTGLRSQRIRIATADRAKATMISQSRRLFRDEGKGCGTVSLKTGVSFKLLRGQREECLPDTGRGRGFSMAGYQG